MQHEKENEDLIILGPIVLFKFGLSEKHTNFEKFFLMVLTNQLIYKIFSNYVCFSKSPNFKKMRTDNVKAWIIFSGMCGLRR